MEEDVYLTVKVKRDLYTKVRDVIGFSKLNSTYTNKELPVTDDEIVNSALYYYFEKMDTLLGFHDIEKSVYSGEGKIKNRFKDISKGIDMKQKELASLSQIDDATISLILTIRNQPTIDSFLKIWVVLGMPPLEEIFYREKE